MLTILPDTLARQNYTETRRDMLYTHLKLINDQVVFRLKRDWNAKIKAIDVNEEDICIYQISCLEE